MHIEKNDHTSLQRSKCYCSWMIKRDATSLCLPSTLPSHCLSCGTKKMHILSKELYLRRWQRLYKFPIYTSLLQMGEMKTNRPNESISQNNVVLEINANKPKSWTRPPATNLVPANLLLHSFTGKATACRHTDMFQLSCICPQFFVHTQILFFQHREIGNINNWY